MTAFKRSISICFLPISECKCNPDGSTTLECGKNNGDCSCKEGFTGIKCQEGLSKLNVLNLVKFYDYVLLFQTASVILMDPLLWNVTTVATVIAKLDFEE